MNREIKFRAWDTRDEVMIYPIITGGEEFMLSLYMRAFEIQHGGVLVEVTGRYNFMQFTGLKDENGEEIYEGDIVKGTWTEAKPEEVEWSDCAGCGCCNETLGWVGISRYSDKNAEIIGNIYENPELLK